jgi:hypothetical protein
MVRYSDELRGLGATYSLIASADIDADLDHLRALLADRPVFFVGSGGTLPVAELAADLHYRYTGQFALAVSPLRFVEVVGQPNRAAVVIFSARAKHPDTAVVAMHARSRGIPTVLITQREAVELTGDLTSPPLTVITVPTGVERDGFLATNSVLAMATVIVRLYAPADLSATLRTDLAFETGLRQRVLVVHGQQGIAAAADIEVRLSELGLADVQIADYRNVAHGRHVGLSRLLDSTTVVALVGPNDDQLAMRTLSAFPDDADVRVLRTEFTGPVGALELLVQVMGFPLAYADLQRVEPSKPKVPAFGRVLYHLPYRRMFVRTIVSPVQRKIGGSSPVPPALTARYEEAFRSWIRTANRVQVGGVVLDYDGTCVETNARFEPPAPAIQAALRDILGLGLPVAFATGRGDSLYESLRGWLPKGLWGGVLLGLHNGSWMQELAEPLTPAQGGDAVGQRLRSKVQILADTGMADLHVSDSQLSIRPLKGASLELIGRLVAGLVAGESRLNIASSAHSVDITDSRFSKERVVREMERRYGMVLAIGDQGAVGGNDFDLLAATSLSISVDECSADPSRCWATTDAAVRGPEALTSVLNAISVRDGVGKLHLKFPTATR